MRFEKKKLQRMCVICRERFDKADLNRLVVSGGKVVVDLKRNLPGRGAYVCNDVACKIKLIQKKALSRVFKREISPSEYTDIAERLNATN